MSRFDDRLRVVRAGADFSVSDSLGGSSWGSLYVSKGLDVLHASNDNSPHNSRVGGRATVVTTRLELGRAQKLGGR